MSHFNPLHCTQHLKKAGMSEQPAIALAEVLNDAFQNMASKEDVKHLENKIDTKINAVEIALSAKIGAVDTKLNWLMTLTGLIGFVLATINFLHVYCH